MSAISLFSLFRGFRNFGTNLKSLNHQRQLSFPSPQARMEFEQLLVDFEVVATKGREKKKKEKKEKEKRESGLEFETF